MYMNKSVAEGTVANVAKRKGNCPSNFKITVTVKDTEMTGKGQWQPTPAVSVIYKHIYILVQLYIHQMEHNFAYTCMYIYYKCMRMILYMCVCVCLCCAHLQYLLHLKRNYSLHL